MDDLFGIVFWLIVIVLVVSGRSSKKAKKNWQKQKRQAAKQSKQLSSQEKKVVYEKPTNDNKPATPQTAYRPVEGNKSGRSSKGSEVEQRLAESKKETEDQRHTSKNSKSDLEKWLVETLNDVVAQAKGSSQNKKTTPPSQKKKPPSQHKKEEQAVPVSDSVEVLTDYKTRYKTMRKSRYADRGIDIQVENISDADKKKLDFSIDGNAVVKGVIWKEILDRRV